MGAYHPIAMVLLIFIYILGITAASKGTSLHFMNFLEIDLYNQQQSGIMEMRLVKISQKNKKYAFRNNNESLLYFDDMLIDDFIKGDNSSFRLLSLIVNTEIYVVRRTKISVVHFITKISVCFTTEISVKLTSKADETD